MSEASLRCPGCGAMAQERPDPDGGVQCAFCGVRFFTRGGQAVERPAHRSTRQGLIIVVALLGLVGGVYAARGSLRSAGANHTVAADPRALPGPAAGASSSGPLSASFAYHSRRPSVETSFMLYGEVTNTSEDPIQTAYVVAVLRDAGGGERGTFSGYSIDDLLAPGASSPVRILVKDPPSHDHIDFEVFPRPVSYQRPHATGLRVQANEPTEQSVFRRLSGTVVNDGDEAAKLVKVTIVGRDDAGKIVGIGEAFAKDPRLDPGASSRWDTLSTFGGLAATYEYRADGWPLGDP